MENKKLILLDIDGTLFDNKNRIVSLKSIEAIKQLHENHIIAIATGRSGYMLDSINEVKPLIDYYILINGQYIQAHRKTIFKEPLDQTLLYRLVTRMNQLGLAYGFENNYHEAVSQTNGLVLQGFHRLGLPVPPVDPLFYRHHEVYQAWAFSDPETIAYLKAEFLELSFIQWMDVGYDIIPKQASKGRGMIRLVNHLQMDMANVIAIGDGDNDYEMVRDAGMGVAMGNATEKVKSVAKYITTDVTKDGVYNALAFLKLIK
ncbi:MAG: Cof-type HAD-IIB family hydrolase [Bacilli bacterium]